MALKRLPVLARALFVSVLGSGLIVVVMASDIFKNPDYVNALWIAEKHGVFKIAAADHESLAEILLIRYLPKLAVSEPKKCGIGDFSHKKIAGQELLIRSV